MYLVLIRGEVAKSVETRRRRQVINSPIPTADITLRPGVSYWYVNGDRRRIVNIYLYIILYYYINVRYNARQYTP